MKIRQKCVVIYISVMLSNCRCYTNKKLEAIKLRHYNGQQIRQYWWLTRGAHSGCYSQNKDVQVSDSLPLSELPLWVILEGKLVSSEKFISEKKKISQAVFVPAKSVRTWFQIYLDHDDLSWQKLISVNLAPRSQVLPCWTVLHVMVDEKSKSSCFKVLETFFTWFTVHVAQLIWPLFKKLPWIDQETTDFKLIRKLNSV